MTVREVAEVSGGWDKGTEGGEMSGRASGGEEFEGHCCDRRDSQEYPGGIGKDNGGRKGNGVNGQGWDEVCWERVGGRGVKETELKMK